MSATHREIAPGIHWIQECGGHRAGIARAVLDKGVDWYTEDEELHVPQNAYLLTGERTLLFDTLSPAAADTTLGALEAVLGDRGLDYLLVSHPDVPHAGNTARILRRYPECTLVAPRAGETHALYHLDDALKVGPEDRIDLGGLELRFPEATFLDAAIHTWMTEERSRTLFTVDWLGFPHLGSECLRCTDELDVEIGVSRLEEFHSRVMFWFQYVDPAKVIDATDALAEAFAGYSIAPAHGLPIREGAEAFFPRMNEVVERVSSVGRGGVL
ncbi:MAG: MBL fold metallo-hydrolase [Gemmatimonadetes bacterium]|nr:MBL fold metallo-hydrolase [Gemmatimonadota bacterium]